MHTHDLIKSHTFASPEELATRETREELPEFRNNFQRDRDRILYSKSFRRLSGKTQVFLSRTNDHIRNRLTHSLEVNQIAGTTSKALGLNNELTEAIALGHDIGHTPFGHVGERALNFIMNNCITISDPQEDLKEGERGFKHNLQGVRVFSDLHCIYPDLKGTNLTNFTLYGIKNHSSPEYKKCTILHKDTCYMKKRNNCKTKGKLFVDFYDSYGKYLLIDKSSVPAWSFEASVVEFADEIAQRHHDVEDAILIKILSPADIIQKIEDCFGDLLGKDDKVKLELAANSKNFFSTYISSFLVNMYNTNLITNSMGALVDYANNVQIKTAKDFSNNFTKFDYRITTELIGFSKEFSEADKCFQKFLGSTILNSNKAQRMDGKGSFIIEKLFKAYFTNPRQLHDSTIVAIFNMFEANGSRKIFEQVSKIKLGEYRNRVATAELRSDKNFEKSLMRGICDHIAGMTDNFVIDEFSRLYGEKPV